LRHRFLFTNQGKLRKECNVPWDKSLPWPLDIHGSKISFYRNIFLSQYCASKRLVWIRPKVLRLSMLFVKDKTNLNIKWRDKKYCGNLFTLNKNRNKLYQHFTSSFLCERVICNFSLLTYCVCIFSKEYWWKSCSWCWWNDQREHNYCTKINPVNPKNVLWVIFFFWFP